jgi:hypothetical protein
MKQQPLATPGGEGSHQLMMMHQQQRQQGQHVQRKPLNWTRGELVGQGAFGTVFVAMDNDTGELIAVKQVGARVGVWWVLRCAASPALWLPHCTAGGVGALLCWVLRGECGCLRWV